LGDVGAQETLLFALVAGLRFFVPLLIPRIRFLGP
jgi:hypothetical protein